MGADQLAAAVVVVDADRQPVHPGLTGARLRAALGDREAGEPPVGVDVEVGAQRVEPGGLEPLLPPAGQVAAGGLLQRAEQIAEGGVAEGVVAEVVPQTGQELLQPDVGDELLEHAGALGVGDAVEVHLDGGQVRDVGGHRMRRRQLVLPVGPRLLHVRERRPRLGVLGGLGLAQHRGERRERLVEPQVVPPLHRDEVAEPHVRHLVQHGLGAPLVGRPGDLAAKDVVLQERHRARVLHRAGVELGNEQLVVLAERVRHAEVVVVEAESLLGLGEQPLGVHELGQRLAAEQAQRDVAVLVGVGVTPSGRTARRSARPGRCSSAVWWRRCAACASPSPCTCPVAPLEMTSQCGGAVTVTSNVAFRSGWSKHANIRLASAVSNCEYR